MLPGTIRGVCRDALFRFLETLSRHDRWRLLRSRETRGFTQQPPDVTAADLCFKGRPYAGLGEPDQNGGTTGRRDIVFITGRFRSGTTFLWNVFRSVPGITAYYEPFNERRWFDPATRGTRVDGSHKNVADYWAEYEGLEELSQYYRNEWIDTNLYMDEEMPDPGMRKYIERMVELAPGRPVLQFNRVDFRLPWLRRQFPGARLIHIFRHPRDQWCSTLMGDDCPKENMPFAAFEPWDRFYLSMWMRDLEYHFPFLAQGEIAHPYQAFYLIWRLSYIFGRKYSHDSICFEDLVANPVPVLSQLLESLGIRDYDPEKIRQIHAGPELGKWKSYAGDDWFRRHEAHCETVLRHFRQ
jgi:hypothetical protein